MPDRDEIVDEMAESLLDYAERFGARWRPIAHRNGTIQEPKARLVKWLRAALLKWEKAGDDPPEGTRP